MIFVNYRKLKFLKIKFNKCGCAARCAERLRLSGAFFLFILRLRRPCLRMLKIIVARRQNLTHNKIGGVAAKQRAKLTERRSLSAHRRA